MAVGCPGFLEFLFSCLLHRVDDDPDEEVEDKEGCQQDVRDEEGNRKGGDGLSLLKIGGEVLERQEDEQGQHRPAYRAPGLRQVFAEDGPPDHPVHEHEQEDEHDHAEQRRDGLDHGPHEDTNVGQEADQPGDPSEAQQAKQLSLLPYARDQNSPDDHEVEHVPPAAEEVGWIPSVRGEPQNQLTEEHGVEDLVEPDQDRAVFGHHPWIGLKPQDDGVDNDDRGDRGAESLTVHEPRQHTRTVRSPLGVCRPRRSQV